MSLRSDRLAALRAQLSALQPSGTTAETCAEDRGWRAAVTRRNLHDIYAEAPADGVAANAFGLGLALTLADGRPVVWGLHEQISHETGRPYAPGLNEMGLRPRDLLLVRARDIQSLLAVGEEALRSPTVGAVVLSAWGEARSMTLTASRRLALAAQSGGGTIFLVRAGADPSPSAARTRWSLRAVASTPVEGDAPGRPAFSATLLRHRGGGGVHNWIMEWDRERRSFVEPSPLHGGLVPLAAQRQAGTGEERIRRFG